MSDPGAAPDPIDDAYVQAETVLGDEAARAARRARVLGAIAREPATPPADSLRARRRPAWRRGGWLVAACVAGLSVFIASRMYELAPHQITPPAAPTAATPTLAPAAPSRTTSTPAAPSPAGQGTATPPAPSETRERQGLADASRAAAPAPSTPPREVSPVAPPQPPRFANAPAPRAFPAEAKTAPPPPVVVTTERTSPAPGANVAGRLSGGARDEVADAEGAVTAPAARPASKAALAEATAAAPSRLRSSAAPPSDPAARLRAAAAAGRTAEMEALLDQGVPVDAPDVDGDTALLKSVQADRPAAAAFLRRHGANLDHRNHAGESARDIATQKGDAELNQAIGLAP